MVISRQHIHYKKYYHDKGTFDLDFCSQYFVGCSIFIKNISVQFKLGHILCGSAVAQ